MIYRVDFTRGQAPTFEVVTDSQQEKATELELEQKRQATWLALGVAGLVLFMLAKR